MPVAAVSVNALSFLLKETFATNLSFSVQAAGTPAQITRIDRALRPALYGMAGVRAQN